MNPRRPTLAHALVSDAIRMTALELMWTIENAGVTWAVLVEADTLAFTAEQDELFEGTVLAS